MAEIMRISRFPGIWEDVQECEYCQGQGIADVEHAVIDYVNGGYLADSQDTCPDCDGRGWVELDDAEE